MLSAMPQIKTSELIGPALDWAVAMAEGHKHHVVGFPRPYLVYTPRGKRSLYKFQPHLNWVQGGPIIEREDIQIVRGNDLYFPRGNDKGDYYEPLWLASLKDVHNIHGPTPLIAAMRCYVASKMGDAVEIPKEILNVD